jgi:hypothetical protein
MGRKSEAQQAVTRAMTLATAARTAASTTKPATPMLAQLVLGDRIARGRALQICGTCWKVGLALLATGDTAKAADYFRISQSTDMMGKYRKLAGLELDSMEKGIASPELTWG